ncbi:MAG: 2-hydroxyacyl-CoA dehydratase subunit D [Candidatus Helarchaeota archaeon]
MSDIEKIIEDAMENLKVYKEKNIRIIGIPQHGVFPDELIHAAGVFPLHLTLGGRDEQEIGDEYLSPTTCPFGRSTLGFFDKKNELYSMIDYLITGTFCNGVQNIGNYIDYFKIPVIQFITPHTQSETAFKFYLSEIYKLKLNIEKITGNTITEKSILASIKLYNEVRNYLKKIDSYRNQKPSKISGTELFYLIHKAILLGPEKTIPELKKICEELKYRNPIEKSKRVFLTGTGICLGDNLYELIESECDGLITGDDTWSGVDFFRVNVEEIGDPLFNLAKKYLFQNMCGRMIPDPRLKTIYKLYKNSSSKGIIYHILKYCDSYSGIKYEFKTTLIKKNIPILELERDFAESNIGQLKTRIEAFLEMI